MRIIFCSYIMISSLVNIRHPTDVSHEAIVLCLYTLTAYMEFRAEHMLTHMACWSKFRPRPNPVMQSIDWCTYTTLGSKSEWDGMPNGATCHLA
jgi:hypothetical protein